MGILDVVFNARICRYILHVCELVIIAICQ